jgi:hypothetical protein
VEFTFSSYKRASYPLWSATTFTLIAALLFAGLQYTKPAADRFIDNWKDVLTHNSQWSNATFNVAYDAVKTLNLEPASSFRPPAEGLIPMSHSQSQKKVAEVYVNGAIGNFHAFHPFLSTILRVPSAVPEDKIAGEMKEFFRTNPSRLFPLEKAVDIAATEIRSDLQTKTDRVVWISRVFLALLFLGIQLIPFSLIGCAAYKDLKVTT